MQKKWLALAEAAGLGCVIGTAFGTGITDACQVAPCFYHGNNGCSGIHRDLPSRQSSLRAA